MYLIISCLWVNPSWVTIGPNHFWLVIWEKIIMKSFVSSSKTSLSSLSSFYTIVISFSFYNLSLICLISISYWFSWMLSYLIWWIFVWRYENFFWILIDFFKNFFETVDDRYFLWLMLFIFEGLFFSKSMILYFVYPFK